MREPLNRGRAIKARILLLHEIITDFGGDISRALLGEKVFNKLKDENAFDILTALRPNPTTSYFREKACAGVSLIDAGLHHLSP